MDDARRIDLGRALERRAAADMLGVAAALAEQAPEYRSDAAPMAGGHLVFTGAGLYVNRVLAAGFEAPPTPDELQQLIDRSSERLLEPTFDVSELSHADTTATLEATGFAADEDDTSAGLVIELDRFEPAEASFDIRPVESRSDLQTWLDLTATGWGHTTPERRNASDDFSRAANAALSPGLLFAHDATDGAPAAAAMFSVVDDFAYLGGMSTRPEYRGRGLQTALLHHRLQRAKELGCTVAGTHADPEGGSMRNLLRVGFIQTHTIVPWVRP